MANTFSNPRRAPSGGQMPTAKQVIIQCPSCQTKFALDSSLIEGITQPRFHCSRCDHIFGAEESQTISPIARPLTPKPVAPAKNAGAIGGWGEKSAFSEIPGEGSFAGDDKKTPSRRLEIPGKPEEPLFSSAPHEYIEEDGDTPQISFNFSSNPGRAGAGFDEPARNSEPDAGIGDYYEEEQDLQERLSSSHDRLFRDDQTGIEIKEQELTNSAARLEPVTWSGFLLLSGVLAGFLALLVATSLYLRTNTSSGAWLAQTFFPTAPRVAPPGVYIKNTKLKKVVLDSGDTIQVVSGKLINQTSEYFGDVVIEAIAFDSLGKPLVKNRVTVANNLARARVRSLTPDMIKSIQADTSSAGYRLKANDKQDFSIALGDGEKAEELSKARYFSARVYSVRKF